MISISGAVAVVVYLLVAAVVFGLLFWLIDYVGSQFPAFAPFVKVARIILVVVGVLVLIGVVLNLSGVTAGPVFRP
jgi:amino acid transporter